MNCDTGEIVTFEDEPQREEFFRMIDNKEKFVPLKDKNITFKELDEGIVENKEVKNLLCAIGRSVNAPRGVRRRLEKKLFKLRKRLTNDT